MRAHFRQARALTRYMEVLEALTMQLINIRKRGIMPTEQPASIDLTPWKASEIIEIAFPCMISGLFSLQISLSILHTKTWSELFVVGDCSTSFSEVIAPRLYHSLRGRPTSYFMPSEVIFICIQNGSVTYITLTGKWTDHV